MGRKIKRPRRETAHAATIKYYADAQFNWPALIETLAEGKHTIESADTLSIHGDAPKDFVRIKEHTDGIAHNRRRRWTAYIAKVGSKFYPLESITEHLLTRIGELLGLSIAGSRLCIVDKQVRFLSRYFLRPNESLVHGIEIFQTHLDDKQLVELIAEQRREPEFYTFQTIYEAMSAVFPECHLELIGGVVQMIGFDAIVGHNDRHPANWGVIVPAQSRLPPRFAPIFDTARAMLWNNKEQRIQGMLDGGPSYEAYLKRASPQIGWDPTGRVGHFDLVRNICQEFPEFQEHLARLVRPGFIDDCARMVKTEFGSLLSLERQTVICRCLADRYTSFQQAIQ